jgi:kumamolisin
VHVDGGGELSSAAGSGETSLDVEQSGGLAPQAKIIVYDAPNTDPGFIDVFYKAASDNLVDSLSVSWGQAEVLYFEAVIGADHTGQLLAFHQAFLELAAQGISTFASATNPELDSACSTSPNSPPQSPVTAANSKILPPSSFR